jgi:hypothetical protein
MPYNTFIYGADETYGSICHWDNNRTVLGSCGASSTSATFIRSGTSHA